MTSCFLEASATDVRSTEENRGHLLVAASTPAHGTLHFLTRKLAGKSEHLPWPEIPNATQLCITTPPRWRGLSLCEVRPMVDRLTDTPAAPSSADLGVLRDRADCRRPGRDLAGVD